MRKHKHTSGNRQAKTTPEETELLMRAWATFWSEEGHPGPYTNEGLADFATEERLERWQTRRKEILAQFRAGQERH